MVEDSDSDMDLVENGDVEPPCPAVLPTVVPAARPKDSSRAQPTAATPTTNVTKRKAGEPLPLPLYMLDEMLPQSIWADTDICLSFQDKCPFPIPHDLGASQECSLQCIHSNR